MWNVYPIEYHEGDIQSVYCLPCGKMQFRGLTLYTKIKAINKDRPCLSSIFRPFSLKLHIYDHSYIAFWCWIFPLNLKDQQQHHVLITDVESWHHIALCTRALGQSDVTMHYNADAHKLSANHMLRCIHCLVTGKQWLLFLEGASASTNFRYTWNKVIHSKLYSQFLNDSLEKLSRYKSSWNSALFILKTLTPLNYTLTWPLAWYSVNQLVSPLTKLGACHPSWVAFIGDGWWLWASSRMMDVRKGET